METVKLNGKLYDLPMGFYLEDGKLIYRITKEQAEFTTNVHGEAAVAYRSLTILLTRNYSDLKHFEHKPLSAEELLELEEDRYKI